MNNTLKDIVLQNEKIKFIDGKFCIDGKPASGAVGGESNGNKIQIKLDNGYISASREFLSENHVNHLEYHPNGEVSYKCTYIDNKKEGNYFCYDNGGSITTKGKYKNDLPYGEQIDYYAIYTDDSFNYAPANEDGSAKTKSIKFYNENGKEHGEFKDFYPNGKEKLIINFVNGDLQGMERSYDIDGNLIIKKTYEKSKLHGEVLEYHYKYLDESYTNVVVIKDQLGKPSLKEKSFRKMDSYDGPFESYYENGYLEKKGQYKNNKMDGVWTFDNPDGSSAKSLTYKDGKKEGFFQQFKDGYLHYQGNYVNDRADGELKVFYETGELKSTQLFVDGTPKKDTFYHMNGAVKSTQTYVGGQVEGVVETFYDSGELESRSHYKFGKQDGLYEKFTIDGTILKTIQYSRGTEVDGKNYDDFGNLLYTYTKDSNFITLIDYYLDGKIKRKAVDEFKLHNETINEFYPNGVLKIDKRVKYDVNSKGVRIHDFGTGYKDGEGFKYGEYKEYHITGQPKIVATYDNDKPKGKYLKYHENGNLASEMEFGREDEKTKRLFFHYNGNRSSIDWLLNNKVVGPCEYFHENGELSAKENHDDEGYIQGEVKTFTKDGVLSGEYNYINGFQSKEKKTYFPNGNIERELINQDHILKFERYFHPNGNMREESHFKAPGYKDIRYFHGDGTIKQLFPFKKENKHGEVISYNTDGKKIYRETYVDGVLEGPLTIYYDNGQKRTEFNYKNNVREGLHKSWFEDGTLSNCFPYKNGNYHGEWKRFYNSGNVEISAMYEEDKLQGKYEEFHDNGNKRVVCFYKEGKILGDFYEYDEDENLIHYSYNSIKSPENNLAYEFYPDGKIKKIVNGVYNSEGYRFKDFFPNGDLKREFIKARDGGNDFLTEFYENGNIRVSTKGDCRTIYRENGKFDARFYLKNNKIHGDYTIFGKDNNPTVITYYENGQRDGKHFKYYENGVLKLTAFHTKDRPRSRFYGYHPSGKVKSYERFLDNGQIAESKIEYFENGDISSHFIEDERSKEFFYIEYYENRNIKKKAQVPYKGTHQYIGKFEEFYLDSTLKFSCDYRGGRLSGTAINYYKSGNKKDEVEYQEGVRVSDKVGYYPDGTKKYEEIINEDYQVVKVKRYTMKGTVSAIEHYENDKLIDQVELFYPSGKKYGIIPIVQGEKEGKATYYYEEGQVYIEENYEEGYIHGDFKEFYRDGVIKASCDYIYGKIEGEKTYYTPEGKIEKIVFYDDGKEMELKKGDN